MTRISAKLPQHRVCSLAVICHCVAWPLAIGAVFHRATKTFFPSPRMGLKIFSEKFFQTQGDGRAEGGSGDGHTHDANLPALCIIAV
jgi:hypothetical protein